MQSPYDCITDFIFAETAIEPADVILIPGCSQPQLMERAAALYLQGMAPLILPSGGPSPRLQTTEWDFLRNAGLELGVPGEAILKEDQAAHTFQNSNFSWKVLQQAGITPRKVILVCKSYHARRALLTYQTDFPIETVFMVSPVTDRTGITRDNWFLEAESIPYVMREVEKIGQYFVHHIPNWVR